MTTTAGEPSDASEKPTTEDSLELLLRRLEGELRQGPIEPAVREVGGVLLEPDPSFPEAPAEKAEPAFESEARFGLATVRISRDPKTKRLSYALTEPTLDAEDERLFSFLKDTLVRTLRGLPENDTTEARERYLLAKLREILRDHAVEVSNEQRVRVEYHLLRNLLGFDRIHALLHDPQIEDISCDGPGIPLFVFHRKFGSMRSNVVFPDDASLDGFVIRMAQRCGKHISISQPILDATLPDRSRLQATLAREVTSRGSSFTIRRFREVPVSPAELIGYGTISPEIAAYFWLAVEEGRSGIVAGGTASGKTTSLNALSLFIPPDRKIVSIEDTREINIPHENWIAGVTRTGFGERTETGQSGAIDTFKLLEAALRQRPEYIIVGEVRGREAFTLFQAMATGHSTYATMHADSALGAVRRLENPPIGVPRIMLSSLDFLAVQMQTRLEGRAVRRVKEVVEFVGLDAESGELLTNTLFRWDPRNDRFLHAPKSYVIERVAQHRGASVAAVEAEWRRRAHFLAALERAPDTGHSAVAQAVSDYYADPEAALEAAFQRAEGGA